MAIVATTVSSSPEYAVGAAGHIVKARGILPLKIDGCANTKPRLLRSAFLLAFISLTILLEGCSSVVYTDNSSDCNILLNKTADTIHRRDARDYQLQPIPNFPHLRWNRFLASMAPELDTPAKKTAFAEEIKNLTSATWAIELQNAGNDTNQAIVNCIKDQSNDLVAHNIPSYQYPDNYNELKRVLGFYSLGVHVLRNRIQDEQQKSLSTFQTHTFDQYTVYYPNESNRQILSEQELKQLLENATANNPLQFPRLSAEAQQRLLAAFAPIWRIEQTTEADQIAELYWNTENELSANTDQPIQYNHISYTRIGDKKFIQLNYMIFFSRRPAQQSIDLYAGFLDGLIWRITLDEAGQPLISDTIHHCGCYHQYFPHQGRLISKDIGYFEEPRFIVPIADFNSHSKLIIDVSANEHFVIGVHPQPENQPALQAKAHYSSKPYDLLRQLPMPRGNRTAGIFANDGLIPGTDRLERWILWFSGIKSPGAMRQWGNHAIHFVGKGHFDDARLFERTFTLENK